MFGSLRRWPSASFSAIRMGSERSVPQSSSRTITSCATSTRRRVRYPESAVRSAVSARPLRAPWVEMKYSSTDRPSRKLDLIGRGMVSPFGLETRPRMPAICRTCIGLPRAPELTIIQTELVSGKAASMSCATSAVACVQISMSSWRRSSSVIRPRSYSRCTLSAAALVVLQDLRLVRRRDDILDRDRDAGPGGPVEAGVLERVKGRRHLDLRVGLGERVDDRPSAPSCPPRS